MRFTLGVVVVIELFLSLTVATGKEVLLHGGIVLPCTSLCLLALLTPLGRRMHQPVSLLGFSMVGLGIAGFVAGGHHDHSVLFAALAVFVMGLPAFGGLQPLTAGLLGTITVTAALVLQAQLGGAPIGALAGVLYGALAAGMSAGWLIDRTERNDWETHFELRRLTRSLEDQAKTDTLTRLPNRLHIQEWLEEEWERTRHEGESMSMLMVDIDHFKQVNDTWGHPAGDVVIVKVAEALQSTLRSNDIAGRWGGEEFVVILSSCPRDAVQAIAERLRRSVEKLQVQPPGVSKVLRPTVSVGGATWDGRSDLAPHDLVALADQALYQAKRDGRNRVCLSSE